MWRDFSIQMLNLNFKKSRKERLDAKFEYHIDKSAPILFTCKKENQ